jgi:hypothetical protein
MTPTDTPTYTPTDTPTITPTSTQTSTPTATPIPYTGCSIGYWKTHTVAWVGYSPTQRVNNVFKVPSQFSTLGKATLLDALGWPGDSTLQGAAQILLSQGVGAALNASDPTLLYPLTQKEVIAQVNAALASQDRATMLNLATTLADYNTLTCPLH